MRYQAYHSGDSQLVADDSSKNYSFNAMPYQGKIDSAEIKIGV